MSSILVNVGVMLLPTLWIQLWLSAPGKCNWDVRLTCPPTWYEEENVTLVCEISLDSLKKLCTNPSGPTIFYMQTSVRVMLCNSIADPSKCGCEVNDSYSSCSLQLHVDKLNHFGKNYTCLKACKDQNPLIHTASPYCSEVKVVKVNAMASAHAFVSESILTEIITALVAFKM